MICFGVYRIENDIVGRQSGNSPQRDLLLQEPFFSFYLSHVRVNVADAEYDSISALQNVLGWDIHFAQGSERNIKLTRTEDIELFKALLETKKDAWLK